MTIGVSSRVDQAPVGSFGDQNVPQPSVPSVSRCGDQPFCFYRCDDNVFTMGLMRFE